MIPIVTLEARYSTKLAAYSALAAYKGKNAKLEVTQHGNEWVLTIKTKTNDRSANTKRHS